MKKSIFLSCLALALSACTARNDQINDIQPLYAAEAAYLGDETAHELSRRYPPAQTTLQLSCSTSYYCESLENTLRGLGFAVYDDSTGVQHNAISVVPLAGVLPEEGLSYAEVRTSDGRYFTLMRRLHSLPAKQSTPAPLALSNSDVESVVPDATSKALLTTAKTSTSSTAEAYSTPSLTKAPLVVEHSITEETTTPKEEKNPQASTVKVHDAESAKSIVYITPEPVYARSSKQNDDAIVKETLEEIKGITANKGVVASSLVSQKTKHSPAQKGDDATLAETMETGGSSITDASTLSPADTLPPSPQALKPAWQLMRGSLYGQLSKWTERAGYQLVWHPSSDLYMQSNARFEGTLAEATHALFMGLAQNGHAFSVTIYTSNNVLEVKGE